jgi:hypothetical protein
MRRSARPAPSTSATARNPARTRSRTAPSGSSTPSQEWTTSRRKPSTTVHFGYGSVAVDPEHPDTVLVGTWNHYHPLDEIFRSTDAGKTWAPLLGDARGTTRGALHGLDEPPLAGRRRDRPLRPDHAIFTTGFGIWATHDLRDADAGKPTLWFFEDQGIEETVPWCSSARRPGPTS